MPLADPDQIGRMQRGSKRQLCHCKRDKRQVEWHDLAGEQAFGKLLPLFAGHTIKDFG